MSIDKFGRSLQSQKNRSGRVHPYMDFLKVRGLLMTKTEDGNYNVENLKLCNVAEPTLSQDASTKHYTDRCFDNLKEPLQKEIKNKTVELDTLLKNHVSSQGDDIRRQIDASKLEIYTHHSQAELHMKNQFENALNSALQKERGELQKLFNDKCSELEERIKNLNDDDDDKIPVPSSEVDQDGMRNDLDNIIEEVNVTVTSRIDNIESSTNTKIKNIDKEIDQLTKQFSALSIKTEKIDTVVIPALTNKVDVIEESVLNLTSAIRI